MPPQCSRPPSPAPAWVTVLPASPTSLSTTRPSSAHVTAPLIPNETVYTQAGQAWQGPAPANAGLSAGRVDSRSGTVGSASLRPLGRPVTPSAAVPLPVRSEQNGPARQTTATPPWPRPPTNGPQATYALLTSTPAIANLTGKSAVAAQELKLASAASPVTQLNDTLTSPRSEPHWARGRCQSLDLCIELS